VKMVTANLNDRSDKRPPPSGGSLLCRRRRLPSRQWRTARFSFGNIFGGNRDRSEPAPRPRLNPKKNTGGARAMERRRRRLVHPLINGDAIREAAAISQLLASVCGRRRTAATSRRRTFSALPLPHPDLAQWTARLGSRNHQVDLGYLDIP